MPVVDVEESRLHKSAVVSLCNFGFGNFLVLSGEVHILETHCRTDKVGHNYVVRSNDAVFRAVSLDAVVFVFVKVGGNVHTRTTHISDDTTFKCKVDTVDTDARTCILNDGIFQSVAVTCFVQSVAVAGRDVEGYTVTAQSLCAFRVSDFVADIAVGGEGYVAYDLAVTALKKHICTGFADKRLCRVNHIAVAVEIAANFGSSAVKGIFFDFDVVDKRNRVDNGLSVSVFF